ncbi:MAG TPA: helix-turn-helix domain-containing protein [Dongiaceae bacterium]|nr:helix-turn-helix domain-containing protein [Dongiaceae bacterium]
MSNITVLRHADGTAQHAILPWQDYQALVRAAEGHGLQPPIPPEIRQAFAAGVHPVRAWREQRGLNQGQLAAIIGISRAYLAQIEGGERTGTLEVMARIARALDRPLENLIAAGPDNFANAVASLGAMPAKLKEIVAAIPQVAWRTKPAGGGFSLVEHACHLRDIDGDGYRVRLERMLTEQWPTLPDIDGDVLARERAYQSADLAAALASFTMTRLAIAARLAKASPEERRRTGLMAGTTEITVEGLVEIMAAHDSEHLDQLNDLVREIS